MKTCTKCGESLFQEEKYCVFCMERQPRFFKRKGAVIILVLACVLLLGIVATHLYMKNKYNPNRVIVEFKEAILNKDYDNLAQIMNEGQNKLRVSKEEAKKYAVYLQQGNAYSGDLDRLINRLINKNEVIKDLNGNQLFSLIEGEKQLFFYPTYEIRFFPIELLVSSNYPSTEIFLDKEKLLTLVDANSTSRVAYLFPGGHMLKATYKNNYTKLLFEEKIDFQSARHNQLKVNSNLKGTEVKIYSNDQDAILYVNGKSTGKKISEIKEFGPVPVDGSVTLQAERIRRGIFEKTKPVKIKGPEVQLLFENHYVGPYDVEDTDFLKENLEQFMIAFFKKEVEAVNSRDIALIAPYIYSEEKLLYNEVNQHIEQLEKLGVTEELLSNEFISYTPISDGYSVITKQNYQFVYEDQKVEERTFRTQYYVIQDGDNLKVHTMIEKVEI